MKGHRLNKANNTKKSTLAATALAGRCGSDLKSVIFEHLLRIDIMSTSGEIALRGPSQ